jgi:hypothetical protein
VIGTDATVHASPPCGTRSEWSRDMGRDGIDGSRGLFCRAKLGRRAGQNKEQDKMARDGLM